MIRALTIGASGGPPGGVTADRSTYNGTEVFSADWHTAISSNPYMAFNTIATESGTLEFTWVDDDGSVYSKSAKITVT